MSSEENSEQKVIDLDLGQTLVIREQAPPSNIHFHHTKRNRQVSVETNSMESGAVSDEIIDAVFEIVALNYSSVTRILEDRGFKWGKKEDL